MKNTEITKMENKKKKKKSWKPNEAVGEGGGWKYIYPKLF